MTHFRRCVLVIFWALAVLATQQLFAATPAPALPPNTVTIQVSDMHCANCAKKIARKLYAIPGVVRVNTDVKKHTAVVTAEKNRQLDSLKLWTAVESAGFEPVKLITPQGEFTTKKSLEQRLARAKT